MESQINVNSVYSPKLIAMEENKFVRYPKLCKVGFIQCYLSMIGQK